MSGCYGCGSPNGSAGALCPECTERRLAGRQGGRAATESGVGSVSNRPGGFQEMASACEPKATFREILLDGSLGKILFGVVAVGVVGYLLLFSTRGPMLATSKPERAYKNCLSIVQQDLSLSAKGSGSAADQKLHREANKMVAEFLGAMGPSLCEQVRSECKRDLNGRICALYTPGF